MPFEGPVGSGVDRIEICEGDFEVIASVVGEVAAQLQDPRGYTLGETVAAVREPDSIPGPDSLPLRRTGGPGASRRRFGLARFVGLVSLAGFLGIAVLAALFSTPFKSDRLQGAFWHEVKERVFQSEAPTRSSTITPSTKLHISTIALTSDDLSEVVTSSSTVEALLADLKEKSDLNLSESEGQLIVDDVNGGSAIIDRRAKIWEIQVASARGWVIENSPRGLTRVSWIGSVHQGGYAARGLSVNDCGTSISVSAAGLTLRYGTHEVHIPFGGNALFDVAIERPVFAHRLEVLPIGLSFGQRDDVSPMTHCTVGWWGQEVKLRGLPGGRYTLRWIGGQAEVIAKLEVGHAGVHGGRLLARGHADTR